MQSANRHHFTFSFPFATHFISFSCVIAWARTSSTMLNRSGKRRHYCLVLYLREKLSIFSLLMVLIVGGLDIYIYIFIKLKFSESFYYAQVSDFPVYWEFLLWMGVGFCQMLFLHLLIWLYDFSSFTVDMITLLDFWCWTTLVSLK